MIRYSRESRSRYMVLGVVFLLVAALVVALTVAIYRKAFTPVVSVRLETDRVGSQLRPGADVKIRGVVVGEVRAVQPAADGAALQLALDPDHTELIPANVSARLLPKTLFGERFVALQPPDVPAPTAIADGEVIGQDRTRAAIEVEQVLSDLLPVLQAVRPADLAVTLDALASALEGRGEQLGDTLVDLEAYLREFHPAVPDLVAVFEHIAPVSDTYAEAAPDLLAALAELTTTTRTFDEQDAALRELYAEITGASEDLTGFLEANRENAISLVATSRSTLELLARYAPEYPCLFRQLVEGIPRAETVFGKGSEHPEIQRLTIEISASRGKYRPGVDDPEYADKRGPRCYETPPHPDVFPQYPPGGPIEDGSTMPPPPSEDETGLLPAPGAQPDVTIDPAAVAPISAPVNPPAANSPAEQELISLLMAPAMGVMPTEVPAWSGLLVGPLLRGTEVTLR
jgi:phospholipid/cholesterol/gamma-HCH transport system substrate-binding protein